MQIGLDQVTSSQIGVAQVDVDEFSANEIRFFPLPVLDPLLMFIEDVNEGGSVVKKFCDGTVFWHSITR